MKNPLREGGKVLMFNGLVISQRSLRGKSTSEGGGKRGSPPGAGGRRIRKTLIIGVQKRMPG